MSNTPRRFALLTPVTTLIMAAAATPPAATADDLLQELKKVPYGIVFESFQDQNWDLFVMRADGSHRAAATG